MDAATQIIKQFDFKYKNFYKEKSAFVCRGETANEKISVKSTEASPERIITAHEIKGFLAAEGYSNTDKFYHSQDGVPYVRFNDAVYVACTYPPHGYSEADFGDAEAFLRIVSDAAEVHKILSSFKGAVTGKDSLNTTAPKTLNELKGWKKNLSRQSRLSDFDVLFLKNYDFFFGLIEYALKYMPFAEDLSVTVCHNALKEETVYVNGNAPKIFITEFTEATLCHCSADLASIILRHVKRSDNPVPLSEIIKAYTAVNPLTEKCLSALRAELTFPDAFVKLCRKYYAKKRTWIPGAFLTRMEGLSVLKDKNKKYIDYFEW